MSRTPISLGPILPLLLPLLIAGCGSSERDASWRGDAPKASADLAADAGYLKPPTLTASRPRPDGSVVLVGQANPGADILLGAPRAEPIRVKAGPDGVWTIGLPASPEVRLYGLSMAVEANRRVQSQGYLAVLPDGRAAQLRAGATAFVYGAASNAPRLLTIDFSRDGAASLAGTARAGSGLSLRIDRTARGAGKVDSQGRFHMPVERPISAGALTFELAGDTGEQSTVVQVSAAPELTAPFRAGRVANGWRIDWMTPGGGMQSTLILDPVS